MIQRDNRMSSVLISWMIIFYCQEGASNIICPDVAELDSTALLSCPITDVVIYHAPKTKRVAVCFLGRPSCTIRLDLKRFNGTVVNETHSYLEISAVQLSDEGSWKCEDQNKTITTNCTFKLIKTPSCTITRYTSELNVGDEITLSVDIQKYYCSRSLEMLLVTGKETRQLIENVTVESIQSKTINSTFMLTDSHFGSVKIVFFCNNVFKNVPCQGENVLVKHHPQTTKATASDIPGSMKVTDDRMIAITAGAAAAAVFVIVIVIIVVCVVKKRRRSAPKDNTPCTHGADNINTWSKSFRMTAPGAYEDIGDFSSAFGNNAYEKDATGSKTDVEMVINEGYMSCDDVKISGPRSCDSLQPETQSTFRPKNEYTQIDAKSKVQC